MDGSEVPIVGRTHQLLIPLARVPDLSISPAGNAGIMATSAENIVDVKAPFGPTPELKSTAEVYVLNDKRKTTLAEVDQAKFSYVHHPRRQLLYLR